MSGQWRAGARAIGERNAVIARYVTEEKMHFQTMGRLHLLWNSGCRDYVKERKKAVFKKQDGKRGPDNPNKGPRKKPKPGLTRQRKSVCPWSKVKRPAGKVGRPRKWSPMEMPKRPRGRPTIRSNPLKDMCQRHNKSREGTIKPDYCPSRDYCPFTRLLSLHAIIRFYSSFTYAPQFKIRT